MKISEFFEQCKNEIDIKEVEKNDGVIVIVLGRKDCATQLHKYVVNMNVYESYGALARFKQDIENIIFGANKIGVDE